MQSEDYIADRKTGGETIVNSKARMLKWQYALNLNQQNQNPKISTIIIYILYPSAEKGIQYTLFLLFPSEGKTETIVGILCVMISQSVTMSQLTVCRIAPQRTIRQRLNDF